MPKIDIDDRVISYVWTIPTEKFLLRMIYSVYFRQDDAGEKTKEFFTQFFKSNPSLSHVIKGLDE